jgi:hypothetical protein
MIIGVQLKLGRALFLIAFCIADVKIMRNASITSGETCSVAIENGLDVFASVFTIAVVIGCNDGDDVGNISKVLECIINK